ncbi:hypothetical protein SAMN05421858_0377 [Haladaptatus litoreus]|uniref:Uncharacterized protein n=1 Tax=Haladaptatus litoreus TaxID=553468 RepID=A0A1N6VIZ2_9EURY|nr:hypothetical protein [Haladaptatus litoreus]SIQ77835.1 hypothetical protein SAMN05421858_0377 [Haladaptatus litoreus]
MDEPNKKSRSVVALMFVLFAVMLVLLGYGEFAPNQTATLGGKLLFSFLWIPLGVALLLEWKMTAFTVATAGALALSGGVELYLTLASNPLLGENAVDVTRIAGALLWVFRLKTD